MVRKPVNHGTNPKAGGLLVQSLALFAPFGWPEEEPSIAGHLRLRTLTWVTVPCPLPEKARRSLSRARSLAERAARLEPGLSTARLAAAAAVLLSGDARAAESAFLRLGRAGEEPQALLWRALLALRLQRPEQALELSGRSLAKRSGAWGRCLRAEALLKLRRPEEAAEDARAALRLEPRRQWACVLLSEAHRDRHRYDEALSALDRLVRLGGGAWARVLRARTLFNFRDQGRGFREIEKALRLSPDFLEAFAFRAEARRRLGDLEGSLRDFNRVVDGRREGVERIRSWRGAALLALGRFEEAVADLTPDIEAEPEANLAWALCQRAQARLRLKQYAAASQDMARAIGVNPKNGWIYPGADGTGGTLSSYDQIVALWDEAVRTRPRWPWGWAWRGETHLRAGRLKEAALDLDRACGLAPLHSWFKAWRGLARKDAGDRAGAKADLNRALLLKPAYAPAFGWRARLEMDEGRFGRALPYLNRLLALDRLCAWGYAWRGECLLQLGRASEAASDLETAVNLNVAYGRAWALLAEAKRRRGDLSGALRDVRRAASLGEAGDYYSRLARSLGLART